MAVAKDVQGAIALQTEEDFNIVIIMNTIMVVKAAVVEEAETIEAEGVRLTVDVKVTTRLLALMYLQPNGTQ